ncbi:hypothetical protein HK101_008710 [Irineochytrium annulatum]|nr:hypothetical protein HK101_008710 [Irineochytrium annulatum]
MQMGRWLGATINVFMKAFNSAAAQEAALLAPYLSQFTQQSNITIVTNILNDPSPESYLADLTASIQNPNAGVDVYLVEESWTTSLAPYFLDMLRIPGFEFITDFVAQQMNQITALDTVAGPLVALPLWADYGILYYRSDVLADLGIPVPQTWNDITNACATFNKSAHAAAIKYCFVTGFQNQSAVATGSQWLVSATNNPFIGPGGTFNFQDPAFAAVLQTFKNWTNLGYIDKNVLSFSAGDAATAWEAGQALFYQGFVTNFYPSMQSSAIGGTETTRKFNMTQVPGLNLGMSVAVVGGYHLAISNTTKHPKEALQAIQFLTTQAVQETRATLGIPPSYKASYNNATLCKSFIPCLTVNATQNVHVYTEPADKLGVKWLPVADFLVGALLQFFRADPAVTAVQALQMAQAALQAQLGLNPNGTATSPNTSGTNKPPTTTTNSLSGADSGSTSTASSPAVIGISIAVGCLVFIGLIVGCFIMQRRAGRWPYTADEDEKTVEQREGGLRMPGSPGTQVNSAGKEDFTWEPNQNVQSVMHSNKSFVFASDYDAGSRVGTLPHPAAANTGAQAPYTAHLSLYSDTTVANGVRHVASPLPPFISPTAMGAGGAAAAATATSSYIRSPGSLDHNYSANAADLARAPSPSVMSDQGYATPQRGVQLGRAGAGVVSPITESMGKRHEVVHPYEPAQEDEMALRPGNLVMLKTAYDDGYAFGEMDTPNGIVSGVFPLACLLPNSTPAGVAAPSAAFDAASETGHSPSILSSPRYNPSSSGPSNLTFQPISPVPTGTAMSTTSNSTEGVPETMLLHGRITEESYLKLMAEKKEKEAKQVAALKERLGRSNITEGERERMQRRLDELELGI